MIVDYIDEHREKLGVEPICEVLTSAGTETASSTYYAVKTRLPSARPVSDAATSAVVQRVHSSNYGVYSACRVHAHLRREGHQVARCTVERLMRAAGLRGISRATGPRTTMPGAGPDTRPDLVDRTSQRRRRTGCGSPTSRVAARSSGWVYAGFVTDVFSRRVMGWPLSGPWCRQALPRR